VDDEAETAPSEEIEAQKESLMTDNIALNEMDESFVNEGEVMDTNAAVKVKSAELENRTDTEKIEGMWQNSVNDRANDALAAERRNRGVSSQLAYSLGSRCSTSEHSGSMLMHLGTETAGSSRPVEAWVSTTSADQRRGSAPPRQSDLMSEENTRRSRCVVGPGGWPSKPLRMMLGSP